MDKFFFYEPGILYDVIPQSFFSFKYLDEACWFWSKTVGYLSSISIASKYYQRTRPTPIFQILTRELLGQIVIIRGLTWVQCSVEASGFTEARIVSAKAHHFNLINHHSITHCEPRVTVCFDSFAHKRVSVRVDVIDTCVLGGRHHAIVHTRGLKYKHNALVCPEDVNVGLQLFCWNLAW